MLIFKKTKCSDDTDGGENYDDVDDEMYFKNM